MSEDEWRAFASAGTRTGKLGVTLSDGAPHITPIWFLLDDDEVVFNTSETGLKARALRRDPRAVLCVDDQTPPYSYVQIKGAPPSRSTWRRCWCGRWRSGGGTWVTGAPRSSARATPPLASAWSGCASTR
ncbi:TIGR03618 family F420-dependent PPOX class oxidoreductase [Nonomuraea rubra]|uniref:TIGR03618 family F420-dependent PPOX class oxidoreductase n=1 Tax=Nonomuraea rubra TaxID=46180 RepID=UPI00361A58D3